MTDIVSAAEAVTRIPGIDPATTAYRSISGGLSNQTFLVKTRDRQLVLRLDGPHTAQLGLDRRTELAILEQAARKDIAPAVVFAEPDAGVLVYEYLSGRSWTAADLKGSENLKGLAGLLHKVHALPRSGVPYDAAGVAKRYTDVIRKDADLRAFGLRCREIIDDIPPPVDPVCCHNDVVAANVLEMHNLRLLDWEYACDNDPLFDIATLIGYHNLDDTKAENLLSAYAGAAGAELRERLNLQIRLFRAIEWLWLAVRRVVTPNAVDAARLERLADRIRER